MRTHRLTIKRGRIWKGGGFVGDAIHDSVVVKAVFGRLRRLQLPSFNHSYCSRLCASWVFTFRYG